MSSLKYRPEVDGLRAIAVLAVILFHYGISLFSGGYSGVDVFFVISGYLITSIILKETGAGTFSFSGFWMRRIRRILPVLFTVVFVVFCVESLFGYRNELVETAKHGLASIFSIANIVIWRTAGDYWGGGAESSLFLHCWSLAVEEQFYLFYPLLIVLILRYARNSLLPLIVSILIISFALYFYASSRYPVPAFYLLPTRVWELAAGCVLAILMQNRTLGVGGWRRECLQYLGFFLLVASIFYIPGGTMGVGLLVPVLGASLYLGSAHSQSGPGKWLSQRWVVYIGKISFSLYLWHWPVIVFARHFGLYESPELVPVLGMSVIILALSVASYHLVEVPLRHKNATLLPVKLGFISCLIFGVTIIALDKDAYYDVSNFDPVVFDVHHYDVVPVQGEWSQSKRKKMSGVSARKRDAGLEDAYREGGIIKQYGGETPDVVVIGDSHATMFGGVIDQIAAENQLTVSFLSAAGVSPFLTLHGEVANGFSKEQINAFNRTKFEYIEAWKPLVILTVRWSSVTDLSRVRELIEKIGQTGSHICLIEQPPEIAVGDRNALQYLVYQGYHAISSGRQSYQMSKHEDVLRGLSIVHEMAEEYEFCSVLEINQLYLKDGYEAWVLDGREALYYDDDHLSQQGALLAKPLLQKIILDRVDL